MADDYNPLTFKGYMQFLIGLVATVVAVCLVVLAIKLAFRW